MILSAGKYSIHARASGGTLGELLGDAAAHKVAVNGFFLSNWQSYRPRDDDRILLRPAPGFFLPLFAPMFIMMALQMVFSFIMQMLTPKPKTPSTGKRGNDKSGVAGLTNTIEPGTPKPVIYGQRRTFPHIVGSYVEVEPEGTYMNYGVLYCIGDTGGDGYEEITDPEINEIKLGNYAGTTYETRLGTSSQTQINGFEDVNQVWYDGREIPNAVEIQAITVTGSPTGGTYTITVPSYGTTSAIDYDATGSEVQTALRAVSGLGSVTVSSEGVGTNLTHTVSFDGTTGDIDQMTVSDALTPKSAKVTTQTIIKGSSGSASPIVYSTHTQVDQVTLILSVAGMMTDTGGKASMTIKIEKRKTADTGGSWVEIAASPVSWKKKSYSKLFKPIKEDIDDKDYWDFRFTLTKSNSVAGKPMIWNVQETQYTLLNYPGNALAAVKGVGSHSIQSLDSMRTSFLVKGKKVKVPHLVGGNWDGSTYDSVWTDKRMWILRDVLTNAKVGLGHRVSESFFDTAAALDVQDYLDEIVDGQSGTTEVRDKCDLLLNEPRPGWDWIRDNLLGEAHIALIASGMKLKPVVDKAQTPGMAWSFPGNIVADEQGNAVKVSHAYQEGHINTVRGSFSDETKSHKSGAVELQSSDIGTDPICHKAYDFSTLTRESQVWRELQYLLKHLRLVKNTYSFKGAQGALLCEPMDVHQLSWETVRDTHGWQGFVAAGSTTTKIYFKDSKKITLEGGKTYDCMIRRMANNALETKTVSTPSGSVVGHIEVGSAFSSAPAENDLWIVGEHDVSIVPIIIQTVAPQEDGTIDISAVEYVSDVYVIDTLPEPSDGKVINVMPTPPIPLDDAAIEQELIPNGDGTFSVKLIFDVTPGLPMVAGTAQAGATGSITLAAASPAVDDFFNGAKIVVDGNQTRRVSDYVGSTKVVTPDRDFSPAASASSSYEIIFDHAGAYEGFVLEISSDGGALFSEVTRVKGTHYEVSGQQQGVTQTYRFTPYSTTNIENQIGRLTKTITLSGDTRAPAAPDSVTVTSHLKNVDVEVALALPLALDFAGIELELWKDEIGGAGTLVNGGIRLAAPQSNEKSGTVTVKSTYVMKSQKYAAAIHARARTVDFTNNMSAWVEDGAATSLGQAAPVDTTSRSFSPVLQFDSVGLDPANYTVSQQLKIETINFLEDIPARGIIAPSDLESALGYANCLVTNPDTGAVKIYLHNIGTVNGGSKTWKKLKISNMGKYFKPTWAPPTNIAAQTLYGASATVSGYTPGANDLIIPDWILKLSGYPDACGVGLGPFAAELGTPDGVRMFIHTLDAANQNFSTLDMGFYVLRNPATHYELITAAVNPPSLGSQEFAKIDVTIDDGIAQVGDFIGIIPPFDLEADLCPFGAYVKDATTITLMLHSISAVDGASKNWKFVVIPNEVTDL